MVSSLKAKHPNKMTLYTGSRDFLRIFTDAANHIPRHRRTKFVIHFELSRLILIAKTVFFRILLMSLGLKISLPPFVCCLWTK